jgi:hypothetical protein
MRRAGTCLQFGDTGRGSFAKKINTNIRTDLRDRACTHATRARERDVAYRGPDAVVVAATTSEGGGVPTHTNNPPCGRCPARRRDATRRRPRGSCAASARHRPDMVAPRWLTVRCALAFRPSTAERRREKEEEEEKAEFRKPEQRWERNKKKVKRVPL